MESKTTVFVFGNKVFIKNLFLGDSRGIWEGNTSSAAAEEKEKEQVWHSVIS